MPKSSTESMILAMVTKTIANLSLFWDGLFKYKEGKHRGSNHFKIIEQSHVFWVGHIEPKQ